MGIGKGSTPSSSHDRSSPLVLHPGGLSVTFPVPFVPVM